MGKKYYNTDDNQPAHLPQDCPYKWYLNCTKCVPIDVATDEGMLRYYLDEVREDLAKSKRSADLWSTFLDRMGLELAATLGLNPREFRLSYGWDHMLGMVREFVTQSGDSEEPEKEQVRRVHSGGNWEKMEAPLLPLIRAGLVSVGDELVFNHKGTEYLATIQDDGYIHVQGKRQAFKFPGPALSSLKIGYRDGWGLWVHRKSDRTLGYLRSRVSV